MTALYFDALLPPHAPTRCPRCLRGFTVFAHDAAMFPSPPPLLPRRCSAAILKTPMSKIEPFPSAPIEAARE